MAQPEVLDVLPSKHPGTQNIESYCGERGLNLLEREQGIYEDRPCFDWVLLNHNQTSHLHGGSQEAHRRCGNLALGGSDTSQVCPV